MNEVPDRSISAPNCPLMGMMPNNGRWVTRLRRDWRRLCELPAMGDATDAAQCGVRGRRRWPSARPRPGPQRWLGRCGSARPAGSQAVSGLASRRRGWRRVGRVGVASAGLASRRRGGQRGECSRGAPGTVRIDPSLGAVLLAGVELLLTYGPACGRFARLQESVAERFPDPGRATFPHAVEIVGRPFRNWPRESAKLPQVAGRVSEASAGGGASQESFRRWPGESAKLPQAAGRVSEASAGGGASQRSFRRRPAQSAPCPRTFESARPPVESASFVPVAPTLGATTRTAPPSRARRSRQRSPVR